MGVRVVMVNQLACSYLESPQEKKWDRHSRLSRIRIFPLTLCQPAAAGLETSLPGPRRSNHQGLHQQFYCLSETTTLLTACPSASLPLKVEVRVFPSLESFVVTIIVTWPPFFIVASIVSASIRFTETASA